MEAVCGRGNGNNEHYKEWENWQSWKHINDSLSLLNDTDDNDDDGGNDGFGQSVVEQDDGVKLQEIRIYSERKIKREVMYDLHGQKLRAALWIEDQAITFIICVFSPLCHPFSLVQCSPIAWSPLLKHFCSWAQYINIFLIFEVGSRALSLPPLPCTMFLWRRPCMRVTFFSLYFLQFLFICFRFPYSRYVARRQASFEAKRQLCSLGRSFTYLFVAQQ